MAKGPYSVEELLSFDRMKRAVMTRVMNAAEEALKEGTPLDQKALSDLTTKEWKAAKEAVRSSPTARQAARENLTRLVSDMVDDLIKSDKPELESLGVKEKHV